MKKTEKIRRRVAYGVMMALPAIASAAVNFQTANDVNRVVTNIAQFASSLVLALSVIVIIYAAFKYMTAGGNEETVLETHKMITWAVVGIIVALVAFSIPKLLQSVLGP